MKKMKLKTWLNEWIIVYKKPFVKPHTVANIKSVINMHVPQRLLITELSLINAIDIQRALNNVKLSRTRLDLYDIFNSSFSIAYRSGLIKLDISSLLIKPKHKKEVGQALTSDEIVKFIGAISGQRLYYYYMFCLLSGCRRSEALSLRWDDIDEVSGLIHIRGTKTEASNRYIPYFNEIRELLKPLKRNTVKVFNHRADYVSKEFVKYCSNHSLKDLRHTFATRCLECGINIKVVQKWLGHTRLDTTANIYTHVQNDFVLEESEKFSLL